uniref:Gag polyprotein n=1 Tax=Lygus hesperus TaxID=30085 RepID=A0A0A9YP66_LYGHE
MDAYKLTEDQIKFELARRSLETEGDRPVLAARLRVNILMAVDTKVIDVEDPEEEIKYCRTLLDELSNELSSFKSKVRTPKFVRIQSKLIHAINRLSNLRASVPDHSGKVDPMIIEARELVTLMETTMCPDLASGTDNSDVDTDKLKIPKPSGLPRKKSVSTGAQTELPDPVGHPNSFSPTVTYPVPDVRYYCEPVYKWKIEKFSGEHPDRARDFIADVEEKAQTRSVGLDRLLRESAELFEGEALTWYRDAVRRVSTWQELKQEFLIAYQAYGNDSDLRERIRSCKMTEFQSIDVFLGKMEGMYSRLERRLSESERLEEILRNLNPFLKDRLVMTPISSIQDLRVAARLAEAGRLRMGSTPSRPSANQVPQTVESPRRTVAASSAPATSVGIVEAFQGSSRETFKCYNCGSGDHAHRACPQPRKKFCYRCGLPDFTTFTCTRCNKGPSKND